MNIVPCLFLHRYVSFTKRAARVSRTRVISTIEKHSSLPLDWNGLLLFQTPLLPPSVSFPWNLVQRETFPPKGASPIREQGSILCIENRSGENASWAGGALGKTPLKGSVS